MKTTTFRFAHLKQPTGLRPGDKIGYGMPIGLMGNTGASEAIHLHLDAVKGMKTGQWRLSAYDDGSVIPDPEELAKAINTVLFGTYPVITTAYDEQEYFDKYGKHHMALDLVPEDRKKTQSHYLICWPFKEEGTIGYADFDNGYGYTVMITKES